MHDITVIAAAEADVEEDLFQDEEYDLCLLPFILFNGLRAGTWCHLGTLFSDG